MIVKPTDEIILSWVQDKKFDDFGKYLISGTIHGKPGLPVAELGRIEKMIKKSLSDNLQYKLGKVLLKRPEYTARNLGAHFIVSGWPKAKDIDVLMKEAANDEDWIVREYAAGTFAMLLEKDFLHFSKIFLKWVKTESVHVKRAIALAMKYHAKSADPKKWKIYLSLIDPLMKEDAEYIRKNLGPFTVGDGLLSRYPNEVLKACKTWMKSKNENVRWNTAMIFTAAAARKYTQEAQPILRVLAEDQIPFVAKAAKKALKLTRK